MKTNKLFAILAAGLLLTSCNDWLQENPKSTITSASFYTTEAQAEQNVNALYRSGAPGRFANAGSAYVGPTMTVPEMLTGYFWNKDYEGQEIYCMQARQLTRDADKCLGIANDVWNNCYSAISRANYLFASIDNIPMADSKKKQLVAEASFFRAFNYMTLVRFFGDVPLITEPADVNDMYKERTPAADVWNQVYADLKVAVDGLPAVKFAANGHRVTKYVAAMALADAYFQNGNNSEAANYAKMVMDSPHKLTQNSDLELGSYINKLRSTDDLDEVVYSYEYNASISTGGWWATYAMTNFETVANKYAIFKEIYVPTAKFLSVYNKANDLRIQNQQFFNWTYTSPEGKTWSALDKDGNYDMDNAGIWYFADLDALLNTGSATKDFNFYRSAEAYLIFAEATAAAGSVSDAAVDALAQVQARASLTKTVDQIKNELKALSKDEFINACRVETMKEFPMEMKTWKMCLRTKKFPVINGADNVTFVDLVGAKNGNGSTFKATDLVFPLSEDELQRNPALVQNAGY